MNVPAYLIFLIRADSEGLTLVTPEDWTYRRKLRVKIEREIQNVIQKMIEAAGVQDSGFGPHNSTDIKKALDVVPRFFFPIKTWGVLIEDDRLPKARLGRRILYELEQNRLRIRELASPAHDAAANALNGAIAVWSSNLATLPESVEQLGQSSNDLFAKYAISLTLQIGIINKVAKSPQTSLSVR